MSSPATLITSNTVAKATVTLFGRIRGADGQLVTQASVTNITYAVSDLTKGTTGVDITATAAACIFDSLQQSDWRWRTDTVDAPGVDGAWGYNFRLTVPATNFPVAVLNTTLLNPVPAAVRYQVDVLITAADTSVLALAYQFTAQAVYG